MGEILRHKKTGGLYEVLFRGAVIHSDVPLSDDAPITVCRRLPDGQIVARFGPTPRGSFDVLHHSRLQTDVLLHDGAEVVVYRALNGWLVWVRPTSEMDDGRFEPAEAPQAPSSTPGEVERLAKEIAATVIDGVHDEPLEYVLRRGYTAMGVPPNLAVRMCRRLAECQIEDAAARTALLSHISTAGRAPQVKRAPQVSGIYTASKTKHADRWKSLRAEGWPINSTWIDEAGVGETACFTSLWERCILEASQADAVLLYREPGDVLKGAFVEAGAALAHGVPVYAIGCEEYSFSKAAGWVNCTSVESALDAIRKQLARPLTITITASPISGLAALSAADATNPQDQE